MTGFSGVTGVKVAGLDLAWPVALPFLERCIAKGNDEYSPEYILEKVENQEMQLWLGYTNGVVDGAGITRIVDFSKCKVCIVVLMGGELGSIQHMEGIARWAKEIECDRIHTYCRPGMAKMLEKHHGFKETSRAMEKRL